MSRFKATNPDLHRPNVSSGDRARNRKEKTPITKPAPDDTRPAGAKWSTGMSYENHHDDDDDFDAAWDAEFAAASAVIDRLLESAAAAGAQGDLISADHYQAEAVRLIRALR